MKYIKPALDHEALADLLLSRGLIADRATLIARLKVTSYFRLSGYLYPFRTADDSFRPGTTLTQVERLYDFDHRLRGLLLDAIESIEVHVRSTLAHRFALDHGPFGYLDPMNFPKFDPAHDDFGKWERKLREQIDRAANLKGKEEFIIHFNQKYGDAEPIPPVWMACELMDFGTTLSFYRGVEVPLRRLVGDALGQPEEVVLSWLLSLNAIRNRCAHHARLWNWTMGYAMRIPSARKNPDWHEASMASNRTGMALFVCRYWLDRIGLKREWTAGASALFDDYPEIPPADLGLPANWRQTALWLTRSR